MAGGVCHARRFAPASPHLGSRIAKIAFSVVSKPVSGTQRCQGQRQKAKVVCRVVAQGRVPSIRSGLLLVRPIKALCFHVAVRGVEVRSVPLGSAASRATEGRSCACFSCSCKAQLAAGKPPAQRSASGMLPAVQSVDEPRSTFFIFYMHFTVIFFYFFITLLLFIFLEGGGEGR